jgi:putative membrane protein
MFKLIKNFLNGLALGITVIIPGVSGGTIAIILGFYFELIEAINHFTENIRKNLLLLIPILLGAGAGVVLFSSLITFLLENYSFPTMLFFIGLIVGIIPHVYFKVKEKGCAIKLTEILLMAIPFVILVALSFVKNETLAANEAIIGNINIPYMFFIFIAGIISAAALVIPGISGSFILLLLGIYHLITASISSIKNILLDITNVSLMLDICKVLGPLALGIIIGGLGMVRLIEKLLKNYHKIVYSIILGLLLGSVCVLFKNPIVYKSGTSAVIIVIGITTFSLGSVLSFVLGKKRL